MAGFGPYGTLLSQDPSLLSDPTFLAYLQSASGTPTTPSTPSYSTSNAPTNVDPNSITATPQQIASLAPASIQSFGNTPQVAATYANAATVNPNQNLAYIQAYENLTNQSLQPTFEQQQQQLQEQLAARGISNTGAAGYLEGNLLGQQGATLASQYAPLVQQGYGYTQSDIAANQANQQAANLTNAGAANTAAATNAGYYNQDVNANYNAYNNYLNTLLGYGTNQQNSLLSAYLNSFGANTGVSNVLSQGLSGQQNAYTSTYGNALGNQNAALGAAGTALGGGVKL